MGGTERSIVIDSHVHIFSADMVSNRERWLSRDAWFESLYTNPRAALVTATDLISAMDVAGVDHAVVCGFPWASFELCREHNDVMADAQRNYPDRISWLGIAPPAHAGATTEARRCFELGAVGLGELNADAQAFDWRATSDLTPLAQLCIEANRPLLLHASEPIGHGYSGKGTATPDRLVDFAATFPSLRIVAAHWGGGLPFYELMPEVAAATANVVYDCGASTYLYKPRVFRTVLDIVGPERVLFGSDYPVLRMDRFLQRVRQTEWRDATEANAVLGGNAARVFGLVSGVGDEQ